MDRFSVTQAIQPKTNDGQSPACLQSEDAWGHAALLDRFVPKHVRWWVYQVKGGSDLVGDHLVGIRPSNVTANALRAGFHLVAHRALPLPVGSNDRVVR